MSTQPESQQQPIPAESGDTPAALEEPGQQGGSGAVFGITDDGSDKEPTPWTGPPPPPAG